MRPSSAACVGESRSLYHDTNERQIEIILDGGVRRGTHVLKALAKGATACSGGRMYLYALAGGGSAGVERAMSLLKGEIERDMILMGCRSLSDLKPSMLAYRS